MTEVVGQRLMQRFARRFDVMVVSVVITLGLSVIQAPLTFAMEAEGSLDISDALIADQHFDSGLPSPARDYIVVYLPLPYAPLLPTNIDCGL